MQTSAEPSFEQFLHHAEGIAAIDRVLRRYGFAQDLDDGRQTVFLKALAWKGKRPTTLPGTRALCIVVAHRHGASEYRRRKRRAETGDAGPTDLADETMLPQETEFDFLDVKKLLAVLDETVPGHVREMFDDVATGTAQRDIAEERGVPYQKIRADLETSRFKFRRAVTVAGMGALLVAGAWMLHVHIQVRPSEGVAHPTPSAAPSQVLVEESPRPTPKEQAAMLRARASASCAAKDWATCLDQLDAAEAMDPEGELAPEVGAMREKVERETSAKPGPR